MSCCQSHCRSHYSTVIHLIIPPPFPQSLSTARSPRLNFLQLCFDPLPKWRCRFRCPFDRGKGHVPTAEARHKVVLFRYN